MMPPLPCPGGRSETGTEEVIAALRAAGCVFAEEEAAVLHRAASSEASLEAMLAQRAAGAPLEHIVGEVEFAGLRLSVGPGVFVPRQRTRLLAQIAVEAVTAAAEAQAGAMEPMGAMRAEADAVREAVFAEAYCGVAPVAACVRERCPAARVHAIDSDPAARRHAQVNLTAAPASGAGTGAGVGRARTAGADSAEEAGSVHPGSVLCGLPPELTGRIDVIAAVPPYVPETEAGFLPHEAREAEPPAALLGGPDGLVPARLLINAAVEWLRPHGRLLLEMNLAQIPAAGRCAREAGYAVDHHSGEDGQTAVLDLRAP